MNLQLKVIVLLVLSGIALSGKPKAPALKEHQCFKDLASVLESPDFEKHIEGANKSVIGMYLNKLETHSEYCEKEATYPANLNESLRIRQVRNVFFYAQNIKNKKDVARNTEGLAHTLRMFTGETAFHVIKYA